MVLGHPPSLARGGENGAMTSAGRPTTEQRKFVGVAGCARATARFDGSRFRRFIWPGLVRMDHLGPQHGERARRIAALRQEIARAVVAMSQ